MMSLGMGGREVEWFFCSVRGISCICGILVSLIFIRIKDVLVFK